MTFYTFVNLIHIYAFIGSLVIGLASGLGVSLLLVCVLLIVIGRLIAYSR